LQGKGQSRRFQAQWLWRVGPFVAKAYELVFDHNPSQAETMFPKRTSVSFLALTIAFRLGAQSPDKIESFSGGIPVNLARSKSINYDVDLTNQPFEIHVPENYDGSQPFGLVVFIPSADRTAHVPSGWDKVLEARRLLLVVPQKAVNTMEEADRLGLGVIAAQKMQERYKVDGRRVYAAGISGGARAACALGIYQSDVFTGTIQSCGTEFPHPVARVKAIPLDRDHGEIYGVLKASGEEVQRSRDRVRFVIVTGSGDFRYANLLDIYNGGFVRDGFKATLIDVPGMKHEVCGADALARALDFIEGTH
jgi:hypothetical protein